MSDIRDDYLRFRVEEDEVKNNNIFGSLIKILVVIVLILLLIVLGGLAYKFLFQDKSIAQNPAVVNTQPANVQLANAPQQSQPVATQNQNQANVIAAVTKEVNQGGNLKKEEIALIVKSVLEQMNKNKPAQNQAPQTKTVNNVEQKQVTEQKNAEDDAALLSNLQNMDIDNVQNEEIDLSALDNIDSEQKVKEKPKKTDTFNKVIIEKKEFATKDDLSKLYEKLNEIVKKSKTETKKSSKYVSKIKKETKVRSNEMRIITVRKGDTLSKIAKRAYGNPMMYHKIYAANPDLIKNPNLIYVGQKLRVPK